ncbi:MAG: alpha/beta fold hydrolase, partial [Rhodospirillaceae bacterium]
MAAAGRRVICVDILGRGGSDWLSDPAGYTNPLSAQDMATLFARLDVEHVDWLGTSMGGIIGMLVAAMPGNPIRRMVINDIGAFVPKSAIARIRDYLRIDYSFQTLAHLRNHLKKVHSPFGPLNEAQWDHMAHFSHRVCPDEGKVIHHYDPALKHTMIDPPLSEIDIWALWDCLRCETLVLRGEHSDLLLSETANNMHGRGPGSGEGKGYGWVEFADAGHAPALVEPEQIEMVTGFFQGGLDALPSEALK